MASFPGAIASFRTMVNRVGVLYDELKTKVIYAEDLNAHSEEIVAIETELGVDPKGSFDDVSARLDDIEASIIPLSSKVIGISRVMSVASGDVAYTGVGFMPRALIVFANIQSTAIANFGLVGSDRYAEVMQKESAGNFMNRGNKLFHMVDSGSNLVYCNVKSFDEDGFTLTWTKSGSPVATITAIVLCLR